MGEGDWGCDGGGVCGKTGVEGVGSSTTLRMTWGAGLRLGGGKDGRGRWIPACAGKTEGGVTVGVGGLGVLRVVAVPQGGFETRPCGGELVDEGVHVVCVRRARASASAGAHIYIRGRVGEMAGDGFGIRSPIGVGDDGCGSGAMAGDGFPRGCGWVVLFGNAETHCRGGFQTRPCGGGAVPDHDRSVCMFIASPFLIVGAGFKPARVVAGPSRIMIVPCVCLLRANFGL